MLNGITELLFTKTKKYIKKIIKYRQYTDNAQVIYVVFIDALLQLTTEQKLQVLTST